MQTVWASLCGVVCGLICAIPYGVAFLVSKKRRSASIIPGLIAVGVSFLLIALSAFFGLVLLASDVFGFMLALVVVFLVMVTCGACAFVRKSSSE